MKKLISRLALASGALFLATAGQAQPIPPQIKIVVPFAPGASNDSIARVMAPQLAQRLNTLVIVENQPGAAGSIGADHVAKSAPDGATLLLTSSTFLTAAATQSKLPFNPVTAFAPVAMVGVGPLVLAVPINAPYKTLDDLLKAARARPGELNYGSSGIGSIGHLAAIMLGTAAGVEMVHVPYKGSALALSDLAGERIQMMLANYSSLTSVLDTKVKLLAVTSPETHPAFPKLAPVARDLPGYKVDIWVGVFAPAGTPKALVDRLNKEINEIARSTEMKNLLDPDGTIPTGISSAEFAEQVKQGLAQWKKIATDNNITEN
jgi:tripartite-type tricarboxylate transporter receptor subunit TctC